MLRLLAVGAILLALTAPVVGASYGAAAECPCCPPADPATCPCCE